MKYLRILSGVAVLMFLAYLGRIQAQPFTNGYSFLLPADDSVTRPYIPVFPRQAITTQVTAAGNHFEAGGSPIRFWGVNFTTASNFPTHAQADFLVPRMRKMGINLVRFHHMDNFWDPAGNIFDDEMTSNTLSLDATQLDRLHYLLSKMKEEGVYANINLLVTRQFTSSDGLPTDIDSLEDSYKLVSMFDRDLIELQKSYASQLLGTTNPYTGLAPAQDPVVAMVEINNENTIYGYWRGDALQLIANGGKLLKRHSDTLDLLWNQFLTDKYGTDQALAAAWAPAGGSGGQELIQDGDFELNDINQHWALEQHNGAVATIATTSTNPYAGSYSAQVAVTNSTGTDWHVQFKQAGFSVQKDTVYKVSFAIRADQASSYWVEVMNDVAPYNTYGGQSVNVTTNWQVVDFFVTPDENNNGHCRLTFSLGTVVNTIYIDNVSMQKFVPGGLEPGESLADQSVRRIRYSERMGFVPQRVADMAAFYIDLQEKYYTEMANYLRNTVHVQAPITGSNALGGLYETRSATALDYIDDHMYWDHPQFPGVAWDPNNWYINNTPMLGDPTLGDIPKIFGGYARADKPYTVSEYNHCTPNIYQTEMLPIIAGYGSFHGMDGLMFFEYTAPEDNWTADRVSGFFAVRGNPAIMSLFPVFSKAFRDGMIAEDGAPFLTQYNDDYIFNMPQIDDNNGWWDAFFPYDRTLALQQSIRVGSMDAPSVSIPTAGPTGPPYKTSTNEIEFHPDWTSLHIHTGRLISFAGELSNADNWSDADMAVSNASGYGVLAWLSLTSNDLPASERSFLAFSSRFQNTNMGWNADYTSVGSDWGTAPTELQPLSADIQLHIMADSIRLYMLDPTGMPTDSVTLTSTTNTFSFTYDQTQWQTPWISIRKLSEPLPVTYSVPLHGKLIQNSVQLGWTTEMEKENAFFEVERSADAAHWEVLGRVAALAQAGGASYRFRDEHPLTGVNYYRLRQVDVDGHESYSNIVTIRTEEAFSLVPFGKSLLRIAGPDLDADMRYEIIDCAGRRVRHGAVTDGVVFTGSLPAGVYVLRLMRDAHALPVSLRFVVTE